MMFIEGPEVLFRVALSLLSFHKDGLLKCDGFELVMEYLKTALPEINKDIMDKIMKQVNKNLLFVFPSSSLVIILRTGFRSKSLE